MSRLMRPILVAVFLTAILSLGVAQVAELDVGPGMVKPDSPVYGLDVALDNLMLSLNLTTPGIVAQERAAEAWAMYEQQDKDGVDRAIMAFEGLSNRTLKNENVTLTRKDKAGFVRAMFVLADARMRASIDEIRGLGEDFDGTPDSVDEFIGSNEN